MFHLIVTQPFAGRAKGDRITDGAEVAALLASDNRRHVTKVAAPAADATTGGDVEAIHQAEPEPPEAAHEDAPLAAADQHAAADIHEG